MASIPSCGSQRRNHWPISSQDFSADCLALGNVGAWIWLPPMHSLCPQRRPHPRQPVHLRISGFWRTGIWCFAGRKASFPDCCRCCSCSLGLTGVACSSSSSWSCRQSTDHSHLAFLCFGARSTKRYSDSIRLYELQASAGSRKGPSATIYSHYWLAFTP